MRHSVICQLIKSAQFARAITDNYIDDDGFLAIFLLEAFLDRFLEMIIKLVSDQVDGAAAKAATHNARTRNALFLGNIIQEVKLFTAYLILLTQAIMCLVHLLANRFVVATLQCVANSLPPCRR